MKSNLFIKIIDETTLELDESLKTTIGRLMAQSGKCRETDKEGDSLFFDCTEKGKLIVKHFKYNNITSEKQIYYVRGEVFEENGKTKVAIYTVHDRTTVFFRWIEILLCVLMFVAHFLVLSIAEVPFEKQFLVLPTILIGTIVFHLYRTKNEKTYMPHNIDVMKNEIIKRVEAVKRWND